MKKISLAFSAIICLSTASFAQTPKGKDSSKIGVTKQLQTTVITDAIAVKKTKDSLLLLKTASKLKEPGNKELVPKKKG